jgi:DNA-binding MarR family transcriptional regulator
VDKTEYEALAAFRYALRQFLRFSEEVARGVGLTPHQHQALLAIKGFPGRDRVTIGELAERLQLKHHSVVGLVDRLVARGDVVRSIAPEDRRQVYVSLTPSGTDSLEQLSAVHRDELRRVRLHLSSLLDRLAPPMNCQTMGDPAPTPQPVQSEEKPHAES